MVVMTNAKDASLGRRGPRNRTALAMLVAVTLAAVPAMAADETPGASETPAATQDAGLGRDRAGIVEWLVKAGAPSDTLDAYRIAVAATNRRVQRAAGLRARVADLEDRLASAQVRAMKVQADAPPAPGPQGPTPAQAARVARGEATEIDIKEARAALDDAREGLAAAEADLAEATENEAEVLADAVLADPFAEAARELAGDEEAAQ